MVMVVSIGRVRWTKAYEFGDAAPTRNMRVRSVRKAGLCEALFDSLSVGRVLKRRPGHVSFEGIGRADVFQFLPDAPRFVDLAEVAECRSQKAARQVGPWCKAYPFAERVGRDRVFTGNEICQA